MFGDIAGVSKYLLSSFHLPAIDMVIDITPDDQALFIANTDHRQG